MSHKLGETPHPFPIFKENYSSRNRRNIINLIKERIRNQQQIDFEIFIKERIKLPLSRSQQ